MRSAAKTSREGVCPGTATASRGRATPATSDAGGFGPRQALRVGCREVDDEAHDRDRLEGNAADSKPADFDQAGKRRGRPHQQAAVRGFDMHAVVADEPRERQRAGLCPLRSAQTRAAICPSPPRRGSAPRARRQEPRRRGSLGNESCRADSLAVTSPAGAPRSARRAPSGRPGRSDTPMRFSARMRPPCASTIWREIERPRPEFCPKP